MDIESAKIALLLGSKQSFKTTFFMHYAYLIMDSLQAMNVNEDAFGIIICSRSKLKENSFCFGKYCEVSIDNLKKIKMKYMNKIDDIIDFLIHFPLMHPKPQFLFIDGLNEFLQSEGTDRQYSKMALISQLAIEASQHFDDKLKVLIGDNFSLDDLNDKDKVRDRPMLYINYFKNTLGISVMKENSGVQDVKISTISLNNKSGLFEMKSWKDGFSAIIINELLTGLEN